MSALPLLDDAVFRYDAGVQLLDTSVAEVASGSDRVQSVRLLFFGALAWQVACLDVPFASVTEQTTVQRCTVDSEFLSWKDRLPGDNKQVAAVSADAAYGAAINANKSENRIRN